MTIEQVSRSALALPVVERGQLAQQLLDSLDVEGEVDGAAVDQAWREEIERRRAAIRNGEATLLTWEEAKAQLSQNLEHRCGQ